MNSRLVMLSTLLVGTIFAQSYTGSIGGRVTDPTGLPISGAQITVTEESTNTAIRTATNESGDYNVSYLKPGSWKVEFQKDGFKAHMVSGIQLQLDQQRRLDLALEIGQTTESVQVTATTDQVNLVSPEIGHVVDSEQLVELPELATNSRGRSPFLLAKLLPGVTTNGNSYTNINGFSFAGGRRTTNEILVDGLPTTNPSDETYTLTPSPDSVEEFKVITTPFSAEYGHTGGGVMIATSKAGTNTLHGSAYDLFR
ncbi:MAG TPA: carboxypeptidase regulatory-like domain-containing protein, partial [Bryobacteraceae bacterium]|nr:carboxypeptidase regulatory-like domain-containing protein [Bryobacteraceae bacterium]